MDSRRLTAGAVGGLVGGLAFGALMQMMGMLGMVAGLAGDDSVVVGWAVHLAISLAFGIGYAFTLGSVPSTWGWALATGAAYGVLWWVVGALVVMPAMMGMPVLQLGAMQLQSLVGHIIYGLALGAVVHAMAGDAAAHSRRTAA